MNIINNDCFKIFKNTANSVFRIEFINSNSIIINSIIKTNIIEGASATNNYKTIQFKAHSITPFLIFQKENKIKIPIAAQIISDLSKQLHYLTQNHHAVICYSPENIFVINNSKFVFLGDDDQIREIKKNFFLISYPLNKEIYMSPELLKLKEIPAYIHYKSSYYSLACFIVFALCGETNSINKKINENKNIIEYLCDHPIKGTKLYWLLSRCLDEIPEKRSIVLI